MASQEAVADATNKRASMKTPPLYEPAKPARESWILDVPTRHSINFTQPLADPNYRNSTIIDEPRPKRKGNRNSTIVDGALVGAGNRNTVFLETPTRPVGAQMAAQASNRHSTATSPGSPTGLGASVSRRRSPGNVRFGASQRHTIADPPQVTITSPLKSNPTLYTIKSPLPETGELHKQPTHASSSSDTLRGTGSPSPPFDAKSNLPPVRPPLTSEVSDLYGLNDEDLLAPATNKQRPSLNGLNSDSSITQKPLIESSNPQARPNAAQIRNNRQSRTSRASRVISTPLSQSIGNNTASMIYGGNNMGLKDVSQGQYGMNQNFGLVSHRASQWLAEEEMREDEKKKAKEEKEQQKRMSRIPVGGRSGGADYYRPSAGHYGGTQQKEKRLKRWVEALSNWLKSTKEDIGGGHSGAIKKENITHTTI